ncbi:hypothetical protein D3C78_1711530 [compost metagenome]
MEVRLELAQQRDQRTGGLELLVEQQLAAAQLQRLRLHPRFDQPIGPGPPQPAGHAEDQDGAGRQGGEDDGSNFGDALKVHETTRLAKDGRPRRYLGKL